MDPHGREADMTYPSYVYEDLANVSAGTCCDIDVY